MTETLVVTDRIWTIPNLISMARLLLVPVVAILIFTEHYIWAVLVLAFSALTDWLDGVVARKLNQLTKLGQALDPAADRLFILVSLVGLAAKGFIPWWLVFVLLAREIAVGLTLPYLSRRGHPGYPVHFAGKAGTFALMYAFPLLLLGGLPGYFGDFCKVIGWAAALWGVYLYWCSGIIYLNQFRQLLIDQRKDLAARPS